jgi:type II secretory pathway pseudopilin PulG
MNNRPGYSLVILMLAVFVLAIGLLIAVPVWQTQIQREKEEELIFRGKQYAQAVQLYQNKNPGSYPKSLEELVRQRFLRRLYRDPMTKDGKWNVILQPQRPAAPDPSKAKDRGQSFQFVPQDNLSTITNPLIVGVASPSTKKSFRLYNGADTYDQWLFFSGADSSAKPQTTPSGRTK